MREDASEILLWTVPECPYKVTIPATVLREINLAVIDAFHVVPRGGVEIGGVFWGAHLEDSLYIQTHRRIPCQYLYGPSFSLSVEDKSGLSGVLKLPESDPELAGLAVIGWYHSHTRSEIFLRPEDLEIYQEYFPEPWQIAMVLRPAHLQTTRAGFFFRNGDRNIKSDAPVQELLLAPPNYGLTLLEPETQSTVAVPPIPGGSADSFEKQETNPAILRKTEPESRPTPVKDVFPEPEILPATAKDVFSRPEIRPTPTTDVFPEKTSRRQRWMYWLLGKESDRRSARRVSGDGLVAFYWDGGVSNAHRVRNISRQGAFVETDFSWPLGTHVTLTFRNDSVAQADRSSPDACVVEAVVVRTSPEGSGFQFLLRDFREIGALRQFLSRWNPKSAQLIFGML